MKKILIVDDDTELRDHLAEVLKGDGYQTQSASSAQEAYGKLSLEEFDIVLLDHMMPKKSGIDALIEIRGLRPKAKVANIIGQNQGRAYFLTKEGQRMIECLKTVEQYLRP